MLDLQEVRDLVDGQRGGAVAREDIRTAIQALWLHQCVYEDTHGLPRRVFAVLRKHRSFFERYFAAAGYQLTFDQQDQMFALETFEPGFAPLQNRLNKEQTLVLIAMRVLLDQAMKGGDLEDGRAKSNTDQIHSTIAKLANAEPPPKAELLAILREFRRKGVVRVGEPREDDRTVVDMTLMPGLRILVPDRYVEGVVQWLESGARADEDVFAFLARRGAPDGAQETAGTNDEVDAS
jgi:Domain of unknown function (DUF4194)